MINSNNFRLPLRMTTMLIAAAAAIVTGCTKVDDTLGANLVPDNQQMKAGFMTLDNSRNPRQYVETRLYQTDSVISSNISKGYFGSSWDQAFGTRRIGFLTQYLSYYRVDSGYFGFRPIFDSAQLMLTFSSWGGDTTQMQEFSVYEVISNDYLTKKPVNPMLNRKDTIFYLQTFDPENPIPGASPVIDKNKELFHFTLGGSKPGPSTKSVTMTPTEEGKAFVRRLMLQEGEYKGRYGIYSVDSMAKWVEAFKGLYICPRKTVTPAGTNSGAIYAASLESSALSIYGRNRQKEDPSLIKDTIGMVFFFKTAGLSIGNVSVNSARHDYTTATSTTHQQIRIEDASETTPNRPQISTAYVEGMGGVLTEIAFTKEFFASLEEQIQKENQSGFNYQTLAFSKVQMAVYFPNSNYDWSNITDVNKLIEQMDAAPQRLGLYTAPKYLLPIEDYNYIYENASGTALNYGGYINRSRGCYTMNITSHIQQMWNTYREFAKRAGGAEHIDWNSTEVRKNLLMYLGPDAMSVYTTQRATLQGQNTLDGEPNHNNAPIKFDIAYVLIK